MKKILSLLSVLTISGAPISALSAMSSYDLDKQLELLTLKIAEFEHVKNNLQTEQTELQNKLENTNLVKELQQKITNLEKKKNNLQTEQTELQNKINELVIIPY